MGWDESGSTTDCQGARDKEVKREKRECESEEEGDAEGKVPFDYYQHCRHLHMLSAAT